MGFVATFVTTISSLHNTAAESAVDYCLPYLLAILKNPSDIALGLESGLLRLVIIVAASIKDETNRTHALIKRMLDNILLPSLVHYAVVAQLQKCFPEATVLAARSTIGRSAFAAAWKTVSALMKSRVEFFDSWEAQSRPSFKACDNLACGKIASRHDFKCCAACQSAHYCSGKCQFADWGAGHRNMCQRLACFKSEKTKTFTTRGKSFMCALLNHDYRRLMTAICTRRVFFMYEHPGEQTITVFTYSSRGVEIEVGRSSDLETCDWASEMLLEFPRAARSGGRMDLHLMMTLGGYTFQPILFPMRTSTATLHDRLVAVTQQIPPGTTRAEALELVKSIVTSLVKEIKGNWDFDLIH
ncbi:hypothetical protein B0H19DRAFT_1233482 [Mycena capillaripes]|nr:hypothetical protein B0H19DRAFT_1233482 [Mycena capillaripes]